MSIKVKLQVGDYLKGKSGDIYQISKIYQEYEYMDGDRKVSQEFVRIYHLHNPNREIQFSIHYAISHFTLLGNKDSNIKLIKALYGGYYDK